MSAAPNTAPIIPALKPSQLRALLTRTIPAKKSVLITGSPGLGKTQIVLAAAAECGADVILMHPVVSDPTDFKGMPFVGDSGATFLPFGELQQLINATKLTVCFLDDLGQATPAVQAAAMQLILARRVNGHRISDHVVFIGATNRRQDRAGVSGILEPVKSRFTTIVELVADLADWRVWAAGANIRPEVIAFLSLEPKSLSDFVPSADMVNSPSPRTWEAVSDLLNLNLPSAVQVAAFTGAVGEARGRTFTAFLRVWASSVSPDVVLTSPDTAPIPSEPSALYALVTALADRVRVASMGRYCRYMERLKDANLGEFVAASVPVATARDSTLANTPGYIKMMSGPVGELLIGSAA